jgi:hypothetical protein
VTKLAEKAKNKYSKYWISERFQLANKTFLMPFVDRFIKTFLKSYIIIL